MTMFKTKEQIEEMAYRHDTKEVDDSYSDFSTSDRYQSYRAGYTQSQKDIKEACSEGFDDCFSKYATESNLHHEFDAHYFWQACVLSKMKELQERDAEIERLKKKIASFDAYASAEEKYQEAVKDIEFLTNDNTLDDIKNNELFTGFEEIRTKYGLDKKEK